MPLERMSMYETNPEEAVPMSIAIRPINLAFIACLLLAGCVQAYVKPPYADESKAPAAQCQTQNGSATEDCKKNQSK